MFLLRYKLLGWLAVCAVVYAPLAWSQLTVLDSEQQRYPINNKQISESSGLACSSRNKKILWTHNDSGHMPIIYAMDNKGKNLATYHLEDIESNDWEDMDAFEYQGRHYLLIADTGDNFKLRFNYRISIIKEPELNKKNSSAITPAWSFSYQFEDNASFDVESAAVDVSRQKIILLTKHTPHAFMFELPLKPDDTEKIQLAVKTGEFKDIIKPTALDISADGKLMSINSYRRIHRFTRESMGDEWVYDYSLSYKKLFQPEAMCLSKNKKHYYVSSEKKPYLLKIKAK